jgi:hypothetical protein
MTTDRPDDPFRGLAHSLNTDLMRTFQAIPAALAAAVEGQEGPIDVPPEQMAAALQGALWLILRHLPNIAGAVDIARGRLDALERRVADLETGG